MEGSDILRSLRNLGSMLMIQDSKLYRFLWYWIPTLGYCIVIFGLSSSSKAVLIPSFYGADNVMHGVEYAILGVLLARSIFVSKSRFSNGSLIISIVALATLYGISDEIHQAFVPGRSASFWDVLADGSGSLIGALFYLKKLLKE